MSEDEASSTNIIEFRKRYEARKRQHPYLPDEVDNILGELSAEGLRAVLHREIELASMRWARDGALLPVGETPAETDSPVFSASEACARVALQEAIRAVFWECGEPIPRTDMPIRIVRLQEEFSAGLRRVLKDIGYV
jgi:hypothetical protein